MSVIKYSLDTGKIRKINKNKQKQNKNKLTVLFKQERCWLIDWLIVVNIFYICNNITMRGDARQISLSVDNATKLNGSRSAMLCTAAFWVSKFLYICIMNAPWIIVNADKTISKVNHEYHMS